MSHQLLSSFLFSVACCQVFFQCTQATESNLPKLWKLDPSTKPAGFYRFFYRLEILDSKNPTNDKEWAHFREAQVRLDIVTLPEGKKRTILYYSDTNEVFYYEPFKCYTATNLNEALYPELAEIFPKNEGSYLKFGIGSLWKYIEDLDPDDSSFFKTSSKADTFLLLQYKTFAALKTLGYQSSRKYKFDVSFSFRDPSNVNTLSVISIGSRYRLAVLDTPNELIQPPDEVEKVFQLPRGYGCARASASIDNDLIYPVPIRFMSLNADSEPLRLLRLDVVASRPIDYSDTFGGSHFDSPDRWRSHSSSVRILSGGYLAKGGGYERNYMVLEKQESSTDRESLAQFLAGLTRNRRTKIRRTKMVWDMSSLGAEVRLRYFELDASKAKCLGYGETKSPLDVGIDLHIAPATTDFAMGSPPLMLSLGIELLGALFTSEEFHLISRTPFGGDKEELVFERRHQSFKINNKHGKLVWEGPVSIVRQYVMAKNPPTAGNQLSSDLLERHMITINFYSKNSDMLLTRVKLLVSELRTIDQQHLLDEINIGDCLLRLGSGTRVDGAEFVDELPNMEELNENLSFELLYYPLDGDLYETLVASQQEDALRGQIQMEFIRSLVEISNNQLDLMQINNLQVELRRAEAEDDSTAVAKISGQLLDKPSLLNFIRDPGQRFSDGGQHIRSLLKESAKGCASSCDHFNCTMFAYCSSSSVCDLLLDSSSGPAKVTWDPSCALFTRHDLARSIISPHELILQMSQTIGAQQEQSVAGDEQVDSLVLKLDHCSSPVLLVPESIESGLLRGKELEELAELEDEARSITSVSTSRTPRSFRQEYSLLLSDRKFKSNEHGSFIFPLPEANHMMYHDCESLCMQNDCLSFSYCKLEKVCQISSLHRKELIEGRVEQDKGCVVMTREYLTKFERVSQKALRPRQTFETTRVDSPSECATDCMNNDSPKCRSFYYCPTETGRASCHLRSSNLLTDESSNPTESVSNLNCDLYARSHLSDFDKFYGKSLPIPPTGTTALTYRGLEAESCALECADKAGKCTGFQVCASSGSQSGDFLCTTFLASLNSSVASTLEPKPSCTFFLVSPGSELHQLASSELAKLVESTRKAAAAQDSSGLTNSSRETNANRLSSVALWSLRVLLISIGVALGYGLMYASKQTPFMRRKMRRTSDRFPIL